jgi:hypothetical protein
MAADWQQVVMILAVPVAAGATVVCLQRPAIRRSEAWPAVATPLASIIGSGFLIVAPVLGFAVGDFAALAIIAIVVVAYAVGHAVRYNIARVETLLYADSETGRPVRAMRLLERIGKIALVPAYVIAATFYLELLGAFALRFFDIADPVLQKSVASGLLVFIGAFGWFRGLRGLEFLEKYAVEIKLAVIAGLLAALLIDNGERLGAGQWQLPALPVDWSLVTVRRLMGTLLIVQGFETSRYLRGAYSPGLRIRTMRYAQWIAAAVYVLFVALATVLLGSFDTANETGIVDLSARLTPILPPMLILGALMSQFSAAIADTISTGGLVEESSGGRLPRNRIYPVVAGLAIALLWSADIYEIIALASRAFAVYYAIQCAIAALHSFAMRERGFAVRGASFALLALGMAAVALFAVPVES